MALNRDGFRPLFAASSAFMKFMARVALSSQFDGNCALLIGTLSVCPDTTTRSGTDASTPATTGMMDYCATSCADPDGKSARSLMRIIRPSSVNCVLSCSDMPLC